MEDLRCSWHGDVFGEDGTCLSSCDVLCGPRVLVLIPFPAHSPMFSLRTVLPLKGLNCILDAGAL